MKHTNKAKQGAPALDTLAKRSNVPAELQQKANAFLNATQVDTKVLGGIVKLFAEEGYAHQVGLMHTIEVIFKNLLKRQSVYPADEELTKPAKKSKAKAKAKLNKTLDTDPNAKCFALYNKTWSWLLQRLAGTNKEDANVALKVAMQLIVTEAKHVKHNNGNWPKKHLSSILGALIESETSPALALPAFEKYARCLDVLQLSYELLPQLTPASFVETPQQALNYLGIVNTLNLGKTVLAEQQYHMAGSFDLADTQKLLNIVWQGIIDRCSGVDEQVHRQVLVVLLERILPHLENPILLTDFLMDSLHQFDGPIALLALQGIFSLMQKQNITYPDVYKKLYNMFYPRMFYNKYKARLFYLADIFLTSTHLPENLVAAFAKRMSRLALRSPTEDAIILIRFVCNLLLRHTGLKRLICATAAASAVEIADPFDDTELDPVKTGAINSSLWEMVLLQKHVVPEVANAARFVSKSLPLMEFDLGQLLEMKESDIFDDEVKKVSKQFMLAYERPKNFALPKNDVVTQYFDLI
ncbi:nucleolar complex protein 4 homolog B [Drosophila nasuta]|uniref:nucleolar complex protein 4 homolog B n=1 Tax=Drosophila nasuta TaxID=42062 RepID=UPI00295E6140|nr:nucleolar complex protein 4 homolog B [Drosophila nasuta]